MVVRERQTQFGPADLLALDPEGNIAIVECKLRRNPDIKRTVVGQLFEYAGSLWGSSYEDFVGALDPHLGKPLEEYMKEIAGEGWDLTLFRERVASNLKTGHFHLIFAVDEITTELRRTIEYLNGVTVDEVSVLALELRYTRDGDTEILIPDVYGKEAAHAKAERSGRRWTEDDFFQALEETFGATAVGVVRQLCDWTRTHDGELRTGSGKSATLNGWYEIAGKYRRLWYCGTHPSDNFCLIWANVRQADPELLRRVIDRLRSIPEAAPRLIGAEDRDFTILPLRILSQPAVLSALLEGLADLPRG